ncbi:MAG: dephospho-CoA kinase [Polyangiaceae bacterium]
MHVFGLTGGIASGKSTVGRHFRARGVPVVDADALARDVVAKGTPGLAELVAAFGDGILDADGQLDRKRVAALVFGDDAKRRILNAATHPRIAAASKAAMDDLATRGEPLVAYEAALLVENGVADAFRPLVVVAASEATQRARVMLRDAATAEEADARIRSQVPLADKIAKADHVITNDGTLDALLDRADEVLDAICSTVGVDVRRYPRPARAGT